jgi:hypothetical protein
MRSLPIVWHSHVSPAGRTCDHCGATRQELEWAVAVLQHALRPLGIEPHLEIVEIDEASFTANLAEPNRLWIAGKPMEEWLDETVGSTHCGSVGGGSHCRTVEVTGTTCAAIPERLILKAALIASSELIDDVTVSALTAALLRAAMTRCRQAHADSHR